MSFNFLFYINKTKPDKFYFKKKSRTPVHPIRDEKTEQIQFE